MKRISLSNNNCSWASLTDVSAEASAEEEAVFNVIVTLTIGWLRYSASNDTLAKVDPSVTTRNPPVSEEFNIAVK